MESCSFQLIPDASDADDFDRGVGGQMMTQTGDIDIEAAEIEVIVITPEFLKKFGCLYDTSFLPAEPC